MLWIMQEQLLWRRADNLGSSLLGMAESSPGEVTRKAREALGWSQSDLAVKAGVSQPAITKIEGNKTRKSKYFPNIAKALDLPLSALDPSLSLDDDDPAFDP